MYADLPYTVARLADRQRVVEVLGIGRVDRECGHATEVAARGALLVRYLAAHGLGGRRYLLVETVRQIVLGQNGVHLSVVIARRTQYIDDLALGQARALVPRYDAHGHLVAVAHVGIELLGEVYVDGDALRVGRDEDRCVG